MPSATHQFVQNVFAKAIAFAQELLRIARRVEVPVLVRDVVQRMREERMAQAASSLTFTTLLALVPLVTVALVVFSTLPAFDALRRALEDYFIESLMPKPVASTVTQYLTLFAGKTKGLSLMSTLFLGVSALALFASIERTLNSLWRAPTPSILSRRWLIYLAALVFAPFLVGVGFYLVVQLFASLSGLGWGKGVTSVSQWSLQWLPVVLATSMWAVVFKTMPNTVVRWSHAWIGALISSALLWVLKYLFVAYALKFGNFKQLYGAFSVIPVFLIWLYLGWLVTLFGATVSAVLPREMGAEDSDNPLAAVPTTHQ
jgi:membrane protein